MSYTSLLIDTCDIYRNTPGVADNYGQPTASWAIHAANQACRLVSAKGREVKVGAQVVVADYKLFLQDIDVTEQDRIVISTVTYEILLVETFSDSLGVAHKQALLVTVR